MFLWRKYYCLYFIVFQLLVGHWAHAQAPKRFSLQAGHVSFEQFVQWVESESAYRFFYNPSDTKDLVVDVEVKDNTMDEVMQKVLAATSFHYAIDPLEHVYVTKRAQIVSVLPPGFFDHNGHSDSLYFKAASVVQRGAKPLKVSPENKLFEIGVKGSSKGRATVAGYIRDEKTGEPISGASLYVDSLALGTVSDQYGFYSLTLPKGRHRIMINSPGMKNTSRHIQLLSDGELNIDMSDYIPSLKEVVVTAERRSNVRGLQMGVDRLNARAIKSVPVVFGEADLLKVVLTLPGVTSAGEGSQGFNVRGGSTDQNLILLNDATIYNPSHMFGFFSAFNTDMVKGADLYKSAIPEKYGGRLSSVLDVTTREGNSKKIAGTGGIGLLTSKLTLEGPLVKDKTSFIVSGRTTYSDWLLHLLPDKVYKNSDASFSDLGIHLDQTINPRNSLYFNAYWSKDHFVLDKDTVFNYGNRNFNLKWKHLFNNKSSVLLTGGTDHYGYNISSSANPVNAYDLRFAIDQQFFRADFNVDPDPHHHIDFGLTSVYYQLDPGNYQPLGKQSLVVADRLPSEQGIENAIYGGDQIALSSKLSLNAGLRISMFSYLGPHDEYLYAPGVPKDPNTIADTARYGAGQFIRTYIGPEIRTGLRYILNEHASLKISYNTLRQYIHMLTNTTSISPTDIWKLSDAYIKPLLGDQLSLGYYRSIESKSVEISLEAYYKRLRNVLDYKSGAMLVMNHHIETDVINTNGKAYGVELLIKKTTGKLNGWFSYAYARTLLKTVDSSAGEVVNKGKYYPADFDKPHSLNLITNYRFSHRYSMSLNVVYSSGRPMTIPVAVFDAAGGERVYYSDRNAYRMPDYFRADFAFTMDGNHKIKQLAHNSWSVGVYNLTARKNPYSVYFKEENGVITGYQLSIFGTAIPFISYNFRF